VPNHCRKISIFQAIIGLYACGGLHELKTTDVVLIKIIGNRKINEIILILGRRV